MCQLERRNWQKSVCLWIITNQSAIFCAYPCNLIVSLTMSNIDRNTYEARAKAYNFLKLVELVKLKALVPGTTVSNWKIHLAYELFVEEGSKVHRIMLLLIRADPQWKMLRKYYFLSETQSNLPGLASVIHVCVID